MNLKLNPELMLLVFIVFLALIFLLNFFLYRPILEFMREREAFLKRGSLALTENEKRIEEIDTEIRGILESARNEASQIREEAMREAQKKYDEGLKSARCGLEEKFRENQKNLSQQFGVIAQSLEGEGLIFADLIQKKISGSAQ